MPTAPLVDSRGGSISSDQGFYKANAKKMLKMFRKVLITRKGWCPRTGKGQRLMGILAVTGYGSV